MTEIYPILKKVIDPNLEVHLVMINRYHPYATLIYNKSVKAYESGNYFKTLPQALVDFRIRK